MTDPCTERWQPIPAPFGSEWAEHDVQPDVAMCWVTKASWNGSEHGEAQRLVELYCVGVALGDCVELHALEAAGHDLADERPDHWPICGGGVEDEQVAKSVDSAVRPSKILAQRPGLGGFPVTRDHQQPKSWVYGRRNRIDIRTDDGGRMRRANRGALRLESDPGVGRPSLYRRVVVHDPLVADTIRRHQRPEALRAGL